MSVIVVRRALVTGMVVVVRVHAIMQFAGHVLMLALLVAVGMRMRVGMRVLVRVGVFMRMRMEQIAVPVPVLVLVGVVVRVLVHMIVRVAGGAGGLVMRHGASNVGRISAR